VGEPTDGIEGVIEETLPTGYGQRHHCIFRLARALKTLPEYQDQHPETLLPVVRRWWSLALPTIRTTAWEATWSDFVNAWERIRSTGEPAVLVGVREWVENLTDDPMARLELACEIIQARTGDGPYYLSCRTAGDLIGTSRPTAARLLKRLVDAGILHVEQPGVRSSSKSKQKATVYRYRGPSILSITNNSKEEK
jgi:hypothetical protein